MASRDDHYDQTEPGLGAAIHQHRQGAQAEFLQSATTTDVLQRYLLGYRCTVTTIGGHHFVGVVEFVGADWIMMTTDETTTAIRLANLIDIARNDRAHTTPNSSNHRLEMVMHRWLGSLAWEHPVITTWRVDGSTHAQRLGWSSSEHLVSANGARIDRHATISAIGTRRSP